MRAIRTKLETLSSTTRTVASFGMAGFRRGCVSEIGKLAIGAPRQESLELLRECVNVNGLLNITVASGLQRSLAITAHHIGRHSDNWHAGKTRHGFDLGRQRIPIHIGHAD